MKTRFSAYLIIYCKLIFALNKEESEKEYAAGNAFLVNRQYSDALSHYHKSIEYDPTNYQAIFRRATTYLAFGRAKPALADLDTVLSQKPDFVGARQQRANVLIKIGQLAKAENDLRSLRKTSVIQEAEEKLLIVEESMKALEDLKHSAENGYCEDVIEITTRLLELHLWDASLYTYRAKCYESNNNLNAAILDMKHATMISSDNTELLYELSVLEYKSADARNALGSTRECLKLNPDHKLCYKFYKWLKKIVKSLDSIKDSIEGQNWSECLENGQKLLNENDGDMSIKINVYRLTSQCNREEGNIGAAVNECNEVLEFDSSDVETLIQRAEAYMADEEYDLAFSDYEKASELDSSNEAASTGKDQAKRAKELIGKRDYYKILGVRRNANKREITKAYRKMAQKWHPDNFQDEKEKKKAEKKFIDIAAAKEVLSDENKRRAFDNGKDPLDSEEKMHAHKGFHEFHGFNPFGGGRGDFFFHF